MIDWFLSGGIMMWPIFGAGMIALGLAVDAARRVPARGEVDARRPAVRGRIDAVLFWGGFAALLGLLGTLVGVAQVANVLAHSGDAPAALAWQGIGVTLHPTTFGLTVLLASLAAWFGLRAAHRRSAAG